MTIAQSSACPLCGSAETGLVSEVSIADIRAEYVRLFRIVPEFPADRVAVQLLICKACDLRYFLPPVTGSEAFYEALQTHDWYYLDEKPEYEYARRHVKQSDRVLEIGSGKAVFAKYAGIKDYTGLEFNESAIARAAQQGIHLYKDTIENWAQSHARQYDVVCSFQVLEHVSSVRTFLDAARHCLAEGGRLILSVPNEDSFLADQTNNVLNVPPHHVTRWTHRCLSNLADILNLRLLEMRDDPLHATHQVTYLKTRIEKKLRRAFKMQFNVVDPRFSSLPLRFVTGLLARGAKPLAGNAIQQAAGHSVTAVFLHAGSSAAP